MKPEIRSSAIELRADGDEEFVLYGLAASYGALSPDLGGFRELIASSAFKRSLKAKADVRFLLNHNPDVVLGRTASGTLTLKDSPEGLRFRCQLDEDSAQHRDVYTMIKRGDISQCSFAFRVPPNGDVWDEAEENGKRFARRTLIDVDLLDCSCVTYPAYSGPGDTAVAARAAAASGYTAIDAANRATAERIGREIEADFQRRIAAAGEAIRNDKLKELGIKI
jgi:uncharacterized protein